MLLLWTIAASAGDVVKVGLIASYTGFATWGSQFQQAVEAYQALHGNTVKGPGGEEIELQFVHRDTASQGEQERRDTRSAGRPALSFSGGATVARLW
jgi:hypothetical protein